MLIDRKKARGIAPVNRGRSRAPGFHTRLFVSSAASLRRPSPSYYAAVTGSPHHPVERKVKAMMSGHRRARRRTLATVGSAVAVALGGGLALQATAAAAQTVHAQRQVSANWSGYVVQDRAGRSFSSVSGSWVQPTVSGGSGQGYAAFWVGLGGASQGSQALEQVGTAAQTVNGQTTYYAWYELVPAAQTQLRLQIHPGDRMSGRVTVNGTRVTVSLSDHTTGASVTRTLRMSHPDTSSAEWIAEAPAAELPDGSTRILPLADFGRITFTGISATAAGHTGSLGDPAWSVERLSLSPGGARALDGGGFMGERLSGRSIGGASAGAATSDGRSFTVTYTAAASASGAGSQAASAGGAGLGASGYGYPGAYGYGYPGAYGYGYPGGHGYPGGYGNPGGYGYGGYGFAYGGGYGFGYGG